MSWLRFHVARTALAGSTKVLLGTLALSNPGIGETVLRTRGRFYVDAAANFIVQGAIGMVVVSDLAAAAGVASIPGPFTDASDDNWFMWEGYNFLTASAGGPTGMNIDFDSRARRRVEEGSTIAVVAENAIASVANIALAFSLLSRLS